MCTVKVGGDGETLPGYHPVPGPCLVQMDSQGMYKLPMMGTAAVRECNARVPAHKSSPPVPTGTRYPTEGRMRNGPYALCAT